MQRIPRLAVLLVIALLAGHGTPLLARQDLDQLHDAAVQFARQRLAGHGGDVQVEGGRVDARLQLAACTELEAYLPPGTRLWGRTHVGVRCQRPEPWSLLVPVTVRLMGEAVFTARPLARGQPVQPADLEVRRVDLTGLPAGVLTEAAQALQRVPGVSLQAGLPLRADMLRGAVVVSTGQLVKIFVVGDGFTVSSEGSALANAAVGEVLPVRAASGRVLKAVVTGAGLVEVR